MQLAFRKFALLLLATTFSVSVQSFATGKFSKKTHTPEELKQALEINKNYVITTARQAKTWATVPGKPVLETDTFQYLVINGDDLGEQQLSDMHRIFAQNLPADMKMVVVTESSDAAEVKREFLSWLPQDRFIMATGNNLGDLVWSRDSYPYPVFSDDANTVELVAHRYFRRFSAQKVIADSVKAKNVKNYGFVYVGGNITATEKGDCFAVNSDRIFNLPDSTFKDVFRCKTVTRLPYLVGIGDVDEVVKVMPNNVILTNQKSYVKTLQGLGYKVTMLPEIADSYRTYANSVILNGTVFMPVYGDAKDKVAAQVYADLGYKVVTIPSTLMSDEMMGSLHCLTIAYPKMELQALLQGLDLQQVQ